MALEVENGTGVAGAEAYASVAAADAYWAKRPQSPFATTWAAVTDVLTKEGALREGADYMDAELGLLYPGKPLTTTQGKLCPRADACDASFDGFPATLVAANIELAARAISSPLAPTPTTRGGSSGRRPGPSKPSTAPRGRRTGATARFSARCPRS